MAAMSTRVPTSSDFPNHIQLSIIPPPPSNRPTNVLILLHGLGDTNASLFTLGRRLCLPETTCISLQGPTVLPFELGGFHWGDDIIFDQTSGEMDLDSGFAKSITLIRKDIIYDGLLAKCGYKPKQIILFGFGQGAMAAISTVVSIPEELGGVVSIGGSLPTNSIHSTTSQTPLLVLGGSSKTMITQTAVGRLQQAFKTVEYHKWNRPGDSMPTNREEMLPIMKFFARRLQSRQGVPEGSVEIG